MGSRAYSGVQFLCYVTDNRLVQRPSAKSELIRANRATNAESADSGQEIWKK